MITLPNGKVCRSLPEQVAANMNKIQEILNVLDGLNIQDNVVAIGDISQILTADELAIVERPVAFILYNNNIYIKKNESGGMAYFDIIFTIVLSTVISFQSSEIEVNLSNGALGITNSTVSTYSVTQIDTAVNAKADLTYVNTELAKKADLTGASFTGPVKATTLEATNPNNEIAFTLTGETDLVNVYNKIIVVNNILYVIANFKLQNNTASPITVYGLGTAAVTVPSEIASKIIDRDGDSAAVAKSDVLITVDDAFTFSSGNPLERNVMQLQNANFVNGVKVRITKGAGLTIPANDEIFVTSRIWLSLF